ncbi:hypothetical protein KP509_21G051300 [Ceratopteris richardii]|uniref:UTP23 sensor motif region domain-containing protein n=1 Tax=Ceratopteris richardii TaxID=49495 RepID=A0A8T2SDG7_CERRI|nr:hypothetical protein KP509_21G051300 [Ceratopteris richardii]
MRVKKQKINRRTIRFYKTCCGFREPFKVLCDGTFLHYLVAHKMSQPAEHLSRLLSGSCRPFTTRCVIAELKRLGAPFSQALSLAKGLDAAKCNHEPLKPAGDCLENLVGERNPEHFFVATQDVELRIKLRQVPAVGIILAQNNFLVLEPPSEKQRAVAYSDEAQRNRSNDKEFRIIEGRERKKEALLVMQRSEGDAAAGTDENAKSRGTGGLDTFNSGLYANARRKKNIVVADRPQFKKKRAKGPNPLSCKKKSKKAKKTQAKLQ